MSTHKDLPGGSQAWASEVDRLMAEVKTLKEVVRRLTENAGLDFANPQRGVNGGATPSIKNPVGQKLSSLADTDTYNVLDGQFLGWSQQGQKWVPVTPATGGDGSIDVSEISYGHQDRGYGLITDGTDYAYTAATSGGTYGGRVEIWASDSIYIGQSDSDFENMAIIQLTRGGFDPWVSMMAEGPGIACELLVVNNDVSVDGGTFTIDHCTTATRPVVGGSSIWGASIYDTDLGIPIWWNGSDWTDALGTVV